MGGSKEQRRTRWPPTPTRQADADLFLAAEFPTSNFNALGLRTGVAAGPKIRRTLLHYDLADFPEYLSIQTAKIELSLVLDGALDVAANVYRLTQPAWVEGAATWNKYNAITNWTTPGGDYDLTTPTPVQWLQPRNPIGVVVILGLLAFVTDALDNRSSQLHVLLRQVDEGSIFGEYTYNDRENDAGDRPALVVTYTRPSEERIIDDPRSTIGQAAPAQPARISSSAKPARGARPDRS